MNDVPLVKTNSINDINTSVLALKRRLMQLERDIKNISFSDDVLLRSDLVDTVEEGVEEPVTSNAVYNVIIPIGFILPQYKKVSYTGWLYLDGRDTTGTDEELYTVYPKLYEYLGNSNVLPDYREFGLVGAEENTTDVYDATTNPNGIIHDHDVYAEGQAKDDQMQKVTGWLVSASAGDMHPTDGAFTDERYGGSANRIGHNGDYVNHYKYTFDNSNVARTGYDSGGTLVGSDVTRGKRKAVYFYIKAK